MIHDFLIDNRPDRNVSTSLDAVENFLITTAKRCLKIRVVKKRHIKSSLTQNGLIKNVVLRDTN